MGREYAMLPALMAFLAIAVASGPLGGAGPLSFPTAWAAAGYSESELRAVETSDEAKLRELRNQEITQLRITLGRRVPNNRRADLYFRLAEIYLEAYRATYLLEGRVHEKRIESGRPEKGIDHAHSRPHLKNGIAACNEILRFGIDYPKMDQVYFFMGFNYGELGDEKQSLKHFQQLSQKFPRSPFAMEAYRQLGEAAFNAAQFRKAQGYYEQAVEQASRRGGAEAATLPRILHKLAWSYYRTKQFDRAVDIMKRAIAGAQKSDEKFLSLREEALRDMAVFLTETGRVDDAVTYFQGVAGDRGFYPRLLERLGREYERNVEPVKATQVYESLLKTHPDSDSAFRVLVKLVDLDLRRRRFKEALGRLREARNPGDGDHETQVAAQNLRAMVRRTATEHHETFRKKGDRAALEISEAYYQAYLGYFLAKEESKKESAEIRMYLAEVKRELGKSKEASKLYRQVVDSRDTRYAKEAGALWTASLAEAIRAQGASKSQEPSELELEFISAADALQEAIGDTPEGREAGLKAAEVLAAYPATQKDAIKRARKIIERWPRSAQGVTAARLWIQLLSDRLGANPASQAAASQSSGDAVEDLKDAIKEIKENSVLLAADQELTKGKLKAQLVEQEVRTKIAAIATHERNKDHAEAAKGYEAFAREAADRELAEKAFANAVANFVKVGDDEAVDRVSSAWVKRYPKSPKAIDSLRASATQYLIQGKFEKAAGIFERLGTEGGDPESLETAARIHEGVGNPSRAQGAWRSYLSSHKTAQRPFVLLRLARSYDSVNQESDAAKAYRECQGSGVAELEAECGARLADLYLRSKDVAGAKTLYKKVAVAPVDAGKKKASVISPWVGYSRYMLALLQEREAKLEPLLMPEARLKSAMNQRLAFLETLSRAYTSAVEAGGPWAIAALDHLADWVMRFADEVDGIPAPEGANAATVAQFRKNLSGVSAPLRKKAIQTWQDAYTKAVAAEALSPAMPSIADRLAEAKVSGIGWAQGYQGHFRLAGVAADGGSEGRQALLEKTREKLSKSPQDVAAWVDYGNLLWGLSKPLLSKLAYDRALSLNPKSPAALSNRAVVELNQADSNGVFGADDWLVAAQASERFLSALRQDAFFLPAKFNRAALLNYYRIFAKARPLWEQVLVKTPGNLDAQDGLAIALQGAGESVQAEATFRKANELGGSSSRFAALYHEAARAVGGGSPEAEACVSKLDDLDAAALVGFEKTAVERLKRACRLWKTSSSP